MLAIVWLALGRADAGLLRLLARHKGLVSASETQDHTPRCWRAAEPASGVGTGRAKTANILGHDLPTWPKNVGNHLTCILHKQLELLLF